MGSAGAIILASDGNSVNSLVQNIASKWGVGSPGSTPVSVGGIAYASQYNAWAGYLRTLNSQISGGQVGVPGNVGVGTIMYWSQMQGLINAGNTIYNWCNHTECSTSECSNSECSTSECSNNECATGEGCASGN